MTHISEFYGIIIWIYFKDTKKHNEPYMHVEYSGKYYVYSIINFQILEGDPPPGVNKKIKKWGKLHKSELISNWNKAIKGIGPDKIDPLK